MNKVLAAVLVALAVQSQAITVNPASAVTADSEATPFTIPYRDSTGQFNFAAGTGGASLKAGGVIGYVDYTQVVDTMTKTSGMSGDADRLTVFSTITIPANTLARNGDAIEFNCAGTFNTNAEVRTLVMKVGSVVISSRTVSTGVSGAIPTPAWENVVRLVRVSAGNQIRLCVYSQGGGSCSAATTTPAIGSGVNTIDEASSQLFTCSADNITAGATSFLYAKATYIPAP
jgi:hypothetical protein